MTPETLNEIVGILVSAGSLLFIVWMVMTFLTRRQQAKIAAEFHARLLDRLGSTKDFTEFLNSDGGARFLDSLALQRAETPQERILRSTSVGVVLLVLGLGLGLFALTLKDPPQHDFAVVVGLLATMSLAVGTGLWLAADATERAARRFGLIGQKPPTAGSRSAD